jgi:hypothetical protein
VNRKTVRDIHAEIRDFQNNPQGREAKFIDWFVLLPGRNSLKAGRSWMG